MRAVLDTNILISYLLTPAGSSPILTLVEAALQDAFTLLIAEEILQEFRQKVPTKPYLAQRISPSDVTELIDGLLTVAEVIPTIADEVPAIGRDRKDDYLLAYALVGAAEYLVTGDDDLLALGMIDQVTIVRPAEFAALLSTQEV